MYTPPHLRRTIDLTRTNNFVKTSETVEEIDKNREQIEELIPNINVMVDYDQKTHAHQYDLWMHSLHTVVNLPRNMEDDMLYLAAFIHDIGKPDTQCISRKKDDTDMHYYGHPQRSMEIVRDVVIPHLAAKGFAISDREARRLLYYVGFHDDHMSLELKHLNRHLKKASFEEFRHLMLLQIADAKAHVQIPIVVERIETCSAMAAEAGEELYQRYLAEKEK